MHVFPISLLSFEGSKLETFLTTYRYLQKLRLSLDTLPFGISHTENSGYATIGEIIVRYPGC
jgi:hypothetical protein